MDVKEEELRKTVEQQIAGGFLEGSAHGLDKAAEVLEAMRKHITESGKTAKGEDVCQAAAESFRHQAALLRRSIG